ncbi:TadE/TadG family type IV pilus assembly protein [Salipaludibacillus sp. HK11]|uniref:TadE/TadG family type IV pilus assembly protein n=1 Tax=Salipaludibacillus sp. HK11 TaxID=3394320 RepID=UPI0039FCE0FE
MQKICKRYVKNEKGSQTIEFVAIFPLIILSFLLIWQIALVAYAIVVTEAAARDGARTASVNGDYRTVIERSAYGLDIVNEPEMSLGSSSYGEEVTITVETKVPVIQMPFIKNIEQTITSNATMPYEGEEEDI